MRSEPTIRLFQTLPHACGYFAERTAQNLVIDPGAPQLDRLYGAALEQGFRRAGGHLYFPSVLNARPVRRAASTWKTFSRTVRSAAA